MCRFQKDSETWVLGSMLSLFFRSERTCMIAYRSELTGVVAGGCHGGVARDCSWGCLIAYPSRVITFRRHLCKHFVGLFTSRLRCLHTFLLVRFLCLAFFYGSISLTSTPFCLSACPAASGWLMACTLSWTPQKKKPGS